MITLANPPRLLQYGDVIHVDGQDGTVVGVDLSDNDPEAGPMFVIDLADGSTVSRKTNAVRIVTAAPASNPEAYA